MSPIKFYSRSLIIYLLVSCSYSEPTCNPNNLICTDKFQIPHKSPFLPPDTLSSIQIVYPSQSSFPFLDLTLVILLPGALVLPHEYTRFSEKLAQSDKLVIIPELIVRKIADATLEAYINATVIAGLGCPINGNFISAQSLKSVYDWIQVKEGAIQRDVVILGHSFGALTLTFAILKICDSKSDISPLLSSVICDGFTTSSVPLWNMNLSISFEGGLGLYKSKVSIPEDNLFAHVYSPFYASSAETLRKRLTGNARFVDISLYSQTNHFIINDYEQTTNHAKTLCARARIGDEALFQSTRMIQNQVVDSMANIVESIWKNKAQMESSNINSVKPLVIDSIGIKQLYKVRDVRLV